MHLPEPKEKISILLWGMFKEFLLFLSFMFLSLVPFQSCCFLLSLLSSFSFSYVLLLSLSDLYIPLISFMPPCSSFYPLLCTFTLSLCPFLPLAGTIFPFHCFPNPTSSDLCPLSASIPDNSLSVELEDCSRREQKRDYTVRLVDRSSNT